MRPLRLFWVVCLLGVFSLKVQAQEVWTTITAVPDSVLLIKIIWTGTQLVAVGKDGAILTSPDGISWAIRNSGTSNDLYSVIWMGTQLVAAGKDGTILTSANGITWSTQSSGTTYSLSNMVWTGKQLLVYGDSGTILTSADGATWVTKSSDSSRYLRSVIWTGTQFAALGMKEYGFQTLTSPDGITWPRQRNNGSDASENSYTWRGILIWTGTQFVSAGGSIHGDGYIDTSPDGIYWTSRVNPQKYPASLWEIIWTGTQLVAAGGERTPIITSYDGITWKDQNAGVECDLHSIAWTGEKFVAVGAKFVDTRLKGVILTSPDVSVTKIIKPTAAHTMAHNSLSLRITHSSIFATLPSLMRGHKIQAVLYAISGGKVLERQTKGAQTEVVIPVSGLPNGRYLLEIKSASQEISGPVTLSH